MDVDHFFSPHYLVQFWCKYTVFLGFIGTNGQEQHHIWWYMVIYHHLYVIDKIQSNS